MLRFPIVYIAFYLIGLFLEITREALQKEMVRLRNKADFFASHDSLTGLFNRHGFNNLIDECIKKNSAESPFALLIVDIDKFKQVNDKYGHDVGDILLANLGRRINSIVKDKGYCCRWGGEEFAILLNKYEGTGFLDIAENIRQIAMESFEINDIKIKSSVSIGVASSLDFNDILTQKDLTLLADKRLYVAKETGRNKVVFE